MKLIALTLLACILFMPIDEAGLRSEKLQLSITGPNADAIGEYITLRVLNSGEESMLIDANLCFGVHIEVFGDGGKVIKFNNDEPVDAKPLDVLDALIYLPSGWTIERRLYFGKGFDSLVVAEASAPNGTPLGVKGYFETSRFPAFLDLSQVRIRYEVTGNQLSLATSILGRSIDTKLSGHTAMAEWNRKDAILPTRKSRNTK